MARASLPSQVALLPFFVLRWDVDTEQMVIYVRDEKGDQASYELGDHLPTVSQQLTFWGLGDPLFVDRAVDSAKEFRAVQVIPEQARIISLHKRTADEKLVADMLTEAERPEGSTYASL